MTVGLLYVYVELLFKAMEVTVPGYRENRHLTINQLSVQEKKRMPVAFKVNMSNCKEDHYYLSISINYTKTFLW